MGSLMAGWDSTVLDHDDSKVRLMRNWSLTKEEVDAFRRQQRKPEGSGEGRAAGARGMKVDTAEGSPEDDGAGESPSTSRDWWTRSSWAFLNEPPQEAPAGKAQSYAPQFHVARIATGSA